MNIYSSSLSSSNRSQGSIRILQKELEIRKKKNPRYSMRAFAGHLQMSPSLLSKVLSGQKQLSFRQAVKLSQCLSLSTKDSDVLWSSLNLPHEKDGETPRKNLKNDEFQYIKNWYHFAILSYAKMSTIPIVPGLIAKRLGITKLQCENAIERLLRLGLLNIRQGQLSPTHNELHTTYDISSTAIRQFHRQILRLAEKKIEQVPMERRELGSVTLTIRQDEIPKLKRLLREFKDQFASVAESAKGDQVYNLSYQFIPLTSGATK